MSTAQAQHTTTDLLVDIDGGQAAASAPLDLARPHEADDLVDAAEFASAR